MSISTEINSGRLAELADAYALGAYGVTHKSSTLLSPTTVETNSIKNSGMDIHMSVFLLLLGCVNCYVNSLMLPKRKERLAVLLSNVQCTCLRN